MFIIYHSRTIFFPNDSNPDIGLCSRGTVGRRQKVTEVFNWFCYAWMNMTWCKYLQTTFVLEPPNWMRLKVVNGYTLHSKFIRIYSFHLQYIPASKWYGGWRCVIAAVQDNVQHTITFLKVKKCIIIFSTLHWLLSNFLNYYVDFL